MKLVIGLGNKGKEYEGTRHNIGFEFLEFYAKDRGFSLSAKNTLAVFAEKKAEKVIFIKPLTYMNLSGEAAAFFVKKHKIAPKDVLVIHDEVDLPVHSVKLKFGGGDAGHNGIKSIAESLGTKEFPRVRIGVGKPEGGKASADYVLGKIHKDERRGYEDIFPAITEFVNNFIEMGYEKAAGRFKLKA